MTLVPLLLLVALAIVTFDTAASFASRAFGIFCGFATIGSAIIYAGAGFVACRIGGWRVSRRPPLTSRPRERFDGADTWTFFDA